MKKLLIIALLIVGCDEVLEPNDCGGGIDKHIELLGECYNIETTTWLMLDNKNLTGAIPPEIENLTNLMRIQLNDNQLTGSIPKEIGNLSYLQYLFLGNNQLTGEIPEEILNLNLVQLGLGNNQLTGIIPESICNVNSINNLEIYEGSNILSHNNFCPPYPDCLSETNVGIQDTTNCN